MTLRTIKSIIAAYVITEGMEDTDCPNLNTLQAMALDLGGTGFTHADGACYVEIPEPEAAQEFMQALDDDDTVEGYDVTYDGDAIEDDNLLSFPSGTTFGFAIYLVGDAITHSAGDVNESAIEECMNSNAIAVDALGVELTEAQRKVTVNAKGAKRIKMKCHPGFKWSPAEKACVKIQGAELATHRKASIHAVQSRKAGGQALKNRAALKTKKAMHFRKSMGL